ncbi:MAG: adenine phosphoribosyltransferase [Chloroflexi bacterium]|nr:adenine phosphoribosyltransferase [Chloroflexota bacterium]
MWQNNRHNSGLASNSKEDFSQHVRNIPDFPQKGIIFRDITGLLRNGPVFKRAIDAIAGHHVEQAIDTVVSIEARGFIIGSALGYRLGSGVVPVRKKGKLPWQVYRKSYNLEYGQDHLEIHQDAIEPGTNVLIVDDVIATGGTVQAVAELIKEMKGNIVGASFLIELTDLNGRDKIKDIPVFSLIKY